MEENVRPILAPRSRPSLQHVFIPPKIRAYFDIKVGDLLKFDVVENRIVNRVRQEGESQTGTMVIVRIVGLLLAAIAVQFVITGVEEVIMSIIS